MSELTLRDNMRALWMDHVICTRSYLRSAIGDLYAQDAARLRLLQNQVDIGDAMRPFYGNEAGNTLAALLQDHIIIAVEVVAAAKANDLSTQTAADIRWTANADAIAASLAEANSEWARSDPRDMMRTHLDQTLTQVNARLNGHWTDDVEAYDEAGAHILELADRLSGGITTQFPETP